MIKISICEDKELFAQRIKNIIANYLNKHQIDYQIDVYHTGEEFLNLGIDMSQYSILFLDIEMGGINGIETAKTIRSYCINSYIVFVTAFAKYSLQGYSVDTTRYILKNNPRFEYAIEESLATILDKLKIDSELYTFEFKQCTKTINLNRIAFIESMGHMLTFHIVDNGYNEYTMRDSISKYDEKLSGKGFIRVQQSYLVNWRYINSIKGYCVFMKDGTTIHTSKQNYSSIKKQYIALKGEL